MSVYLDKKSMNTSRIITWVSFVVLIGLIVWGVVVANNRTPGARTARVVSLPEPVSALDWSAGSSTSETVLVEYSDFQCPSCGLYFPLLEKLVKDHGSEFHFVYRHFPLPQHKNAVPAALASEAAGKQGKFWEMHAMLFMNQAAWEELDDTTATFDSYAAKIGLSVPQFKSDLSDPAIVKKVSDAFSTARAAGIPGTPALFLNGKMIDTPSSYEALEKTIQNKI